MYHNSSCVVYCTNTSEAVGMKQSGAEARKRERARARREGESVSPTGGHEESASPKGEREPERRARSGELVGEPRKSRREPRE